MAHLTYRSVNVLHVLVSLVFGLFHPIVSLENQHAESVKLNRKAGPPVAKALDNVYVEELSLSNLNDPDYVLRKKILYTLNSEVSLEVEHTHTNLDAKDENGTRTPTLASIIRECVENGEQFPRLRMMNYMEWHIKRWRDFFDRRLTSPSVDAGLRSSAAFRETVKLDETPVYYMMTDLKSHKLNDVQICHHFNAKGEYLGTWEWGYHLEFKVAESLLCNQFAYGEGSKLLNKIMDSTATKADTIKHLSRL